MRHLEVKPDVDLADLWSRAARDEKYDLITVLKSSRRGGELYSVLASLAPLVAVGGKIAIEPFAESLAGETRVEATDVFLAVHRKWHRQITSEQVLELHRGDYLFFEEATEATRVQSKYVEEIVPVGPRGSGGKKVVSYSLFNDCRLAPEESQHRLAEQHLPVLVRAHAALFPGYELRIHHDESIYASNYGAVLKGLERRGLVKLVYVPSKSTDGKCRKMLWRLLPLWDEDVDYVFCRDVDSLPTWRERCIAEEFIASGCAAGVIHDDPMHAGLMGGLCHFDAKQFRSLVDIPAEVFFNTVSVGKESVDWGIHGADQNFLNGYVARLMPSILEHSLFIAKDDAGERIKRPPTWPQAKVVYEIAEPSQGVVDSVDKDVREHSGDFAHYLGSAGYSVEQALEFYNGL